MELIFEILLELVCFPVISGLFVLVINRFRKLADPYPEYSPEPRYFVEIGRDGLIGGVFGVPIAMSFSYLILRILGLDFSYFIGERSPLYLCGFILQIKFFFSLLFGGFLGGIFADYFVRRFDAWPSRMYLVVGGFFLSLTTTALFLFI